MSKTIFKHEFMVGKSVIMNIKGKVSSWYCLDVWNDGLGVFLNFDDSEEIEIMDWESKIIEFDFN